MNVARGTGDGGNDVEKSVIVDESVAMANAGSSKASAIETTPHHSKADTLQDIVSDIVDNLDFSISANGKITIAPPNSFEICFFSSFFLFFLSFVHHFSRLDAFGS